VVAHHKVSSVFSTAAGRGIKTYRLDDVAFSTCSSRFKFEAPNQDAMMVVVVVVVGVGVGGSLSGESGGGDAMNWWEELERGFVGIAPEVFSKCWLSWRGPVRLGGSYEGGDGWT